MHLVSFPRTGLGWRLALGVAPSRSGHSPKFGSYLTPRSSGYADFIPWAVTLWEREKQLSLCCGLDTRGSPHTAAHMNLLTLRLTSSHPTSAPFSALASALPALPSSKEPQHLLSPLPSRKRRQICARVHSADTHPRFISTATSATTATPGRAGIVSLRGEHESTQGLKRIQWEPDRCLDIIICFTPLCQPPSLPILSQLASEGSYSEHKGQVWPGVFGNAGQFGDFELSSSPPTTCQKPKSLWSLTSSEPWSWHLRACLSSPFFSLPLPLLEHR